MCKCAVLIGRRLIDNGVFDYCAIDNVMDDAKNISELVSAGNVSAGNIRCKCRTDSTYAAIPENSLYIRSSPQILQ